MTLFAIGRTIGLDVTKVESDAMTLRSIDCALAYEQFRWVRSFGDEAIGSTFCVYEALRPEDIWDHALRAVIPVDDVREVEEYLPERFGVTPLPPEAGSTLYLIKRQMPESTTREETDAATARAADCASDYPGIRWVRSFWDERRKLAHCVYWATDPELLRAHAERSRVPCDEIREVTEILPSQYGVVATASGTES